jgi:spore maturation protein CgeB
MKILVLTADYEAFLRWHYARSGALWKASYLEQLRERAETLFGVAGFYSRSFAMQGHCASVIYPNNGWMQAAWASEHGLHCSSSRPPEIDARAPPADFVMHLKRRLRPYKRLLAPLARKLGLVKSLSSTERRVLLAQIEDFNPDVILNQDIEVIDSKVMRYATRRGRILIAQCGVQPPDDFDAGPYNLGVSPFPWVVEFYRSRGLAAALWRLAFEPTVLESLGPKLDKDIDVSFVGGLASDHGTRIKLLEAIAKKYPLQLWLSNFKGIPRQSPLHACVRGEAWGREMYQIIRRSKITLNSHIDASRGTASNLRLYEATGVGTFLLTDDLPNLSTLFAPGAQVETYRSPEQCVEKIKHFLSAEPERERIAQAGQRQTLEHHTFQRRVDELSILIDHLT